MKTYWTNFAKTGNPNGGTAPAWPAYHDSALEPNQTPKRRARLTLTSS